MKSKPQKSKTQNKTSDKIVDECSDEELRKVLMDREEEKLNAQKEYANKTNENEHKINALEIAFKKAEKDVVKDMKKARALRNKAEKLAAEISEKHGIPIDGGYVPESKSKWDYELEGEILNLVVDNYGYEHSGWWSPSAYC